MADEVRQDLVRRHERSDVAPRWPVFAGAAMLLLLPIAIAIVFGLMNTLWVEPPGKPDLFEREPRIVNAPHLTVHPHANLMQLREQWLERLTSYGWVDRSAGIVHIPIQEAMERLVARGEPDKAGDQPRAKAPALEQSRRPPDE